MCAGPATMLRVVSLSLLAILAAPRAFSATHVWLGTASNLKTIAIPIFGDTRHEGDETFLVTLSAPLNGTLDTARATVTIIDDDVPIPPRHRGSRH